MRKQRKIIHVDMDAFFASVEQRDYPAYQNRPLIVGGKPNSRGVVAACSYEARVFGIHSAMPSARAYALCPEAIFVAPRFEVYRDISKQIREVFWRYASQVEPLSLDEAYLDVTYTADYNGSATRIAQAIKHDIFNATGLIASAGVSYNKFLAKIASDMDKPNGLYVIKPEQGMDFIAQLPIGKFHGIGPATERKMHAAGIQTGSDLYQWEKDALIAHFGKVGDYYYHIARGIDHRPVKSHRIRKSLGKETTFTRDILDIEQLLEHAEHLAKKVFDNLQNHNLKPRTLTLKVKYADFKQVTRSTTQSEALQTYEAIQALLPALLNQTHAGKKAIRLVGVSVSSFVNISEQNAQKNQHIQQPSEQITLPLKD